MKLKKTLFCVTSAFLALLLVTAASYGEENGNMHGTMAMPQSAGSFFPAAMQAVSGNNAGVMDRATAFYFANRAFASAGITPTPQTLAATANAILAADEARVFQGLPQSASQWAPQNTGYSSPAAGQTSNANGAGVMDRATAMHFASRAFASAGMTVPQETIAAVANAIIAADEARVFQGLPQSASKLAPQAR